MATETSMLPTLTAELVKGYLEQAVQEYGPEYVDINASQGRRCHNVYWNDNDQVTGRCIASQVLSYHGVDDDRLAHHNAHGIEDVLDALDVPADNEARTMLLTAQFEQDCGQPWGEAVGAVKEQG